MLQYVYVAACGALYVCCNMQLCSYRYLSKNVLQCVLRCVCVAVCAAVCAAVTLWHVCCHLQLCYSKYTCCSACCSMCVLQRVLQCVFAATHLYSHRLPQIWRDFRKADLEIFEFFRTQSSQLSGTKYSLRYFQKTCSIIVCFIPLDWVRNLLIRFIVIS